MELGGQVALVTGGAHRLGRAIALALAGAGALIALHYHKSAEAAEQTAQAIRDAGSDVCLIEADLAEPQSITDIIDKIEKHFGRLDVLVNSAATFQKVPVDEIKLDDWDQVLAVNLRAPFFLSQQAARLMRLSKRESPAAIVNIADLSGVHAWAGYAHHGASKAGLIHLTRLLARELAPQVRVNAIVPGAILPPPGMKADSPAWRKMSERNPLQRAASAGDIGRVVVFLAEEDFITGVVLPVDGGEGLLGPVGH